MKKDDIHYCMLVLYNLEADWVTEICSLLKRKQNHHMHKDKAMINSVPESISFILHKNSI